MKIKLVLLIIIFSIIIAGCTSNNSSRDLSNCQKYYDGCNTCDVIDGEVIQCTERACEQYEEAKCLKAIGEQSEQVEEEFPVVEEQPQVEPMKITTSVFTNGLIPEKYTCDGSDTIPPLNFENIPQDATSLALIMYDPDVPRDIRADGLWTHWVVFNIPITTTTISEGQEPQGTISRRYEGPCPPDDEHRYFFRLYALDTNLDLPHAANKQQFDTAIQDHILAEAELIGRYG